MEKTNVKTSLTRKGGAVASAVAMLASAVVLAMAPMSQAQAYTATREDVGVEGPKMCKNSCDVTYVYRAKGADWPNSGIKGLNKHAKWVKSGRKNAFNAAMKAAVCPSGKYYVPHSAYKEYNDIYGSNWFRQNIIFKCKNGNGNARVNDLRF